MERINHLLVFQFLRILIKRNPALATTMEEYHRRSIITLILGGMVQGQVLSTQINGLDIRILLQRE